MLVVDEMDVYVAQSSSFSMPQNAFTTLMANTRFNEVKVTYSDTAADLHQLFTDWHKYDMKHYLNWNAGSTDVRYKVNVVAMHMLSQVDKVESLLFLSKPPPATGTAEYNNWCQTLIQISKQVSTDCMERMATIDNKTGCQARVSSFCDRVKVYNTNNHLAYKFLCNKYGVITPAEVSKKSTSSSSSSSKKK